MNNKSKKTMQQMAMLLLIACLVGVTSFLCLGLSLVNVNNKGGDNRPSDEQKEKARDVQGELEAIKAEFERWQQEREAKGEELVAVNAELVRWLNELEKGRDQKEEKTARNLELGEQMETSKIALAQYFEELAKQKQLEKDKAALEKERNELNEERKRRGLQSEASARERDEIERDVEELRGTSKKKTDDLNELIGEINIEKTIYRPGKVVDPRFRDPQFVECTEGKIVLQPQNVSISTADLARFASHLGTDSNLECVCFLIRPDGFTSFEEARKVVRGKGVNFGYQPVDANRTIIYDQKGRGQDV